MNKLIYLATPYTHKDKWVMHLRQLLVTAAAAQLIKKGYHIFSPITESHCYQQVEDVGFTWQFWEKHDTMMLSKCDELWVLKLTGWKESVGVQAEIKLARSAKKKIKYILPSKLLGKDINRIIE